MKSYEYTVKALRKQLGERYGPTWSGTDWDMANYLMAIKHWPAAEWLFEKIEREGQLT